MSAGTAVRCPTCGANNVLGMLNCAWCGARLFAWLGDPFGNLDLGGAEAGAVLREQRRAGPPVGKLVLGGLLAWALGYLWGLWSLLLVSLLGLVLWKSPRIG